MAKKKTRNLHVDSMSFDYSKLAIHVATEVQGAAGRIRQGLKKTVIEIIQIGQELAAVKAALPHGQFTDWLRAEFDWAERMAQNFMRVAERFGPKAAMIADLTIQPTAAYLLAAPSTPNAALDTAIERALGGTKITTKLAKQIIAELRQQQVQTPKPSLTAKKLAPKLLRLLNRYRDRCSPTDVAELATHLHQFADELTKSKPPQKKRQE